MVAAAAAAAAAAAHGRADLPPSTGTSGGAAPGDKSDRLWNGGGDAWCGDADAGSEGVDAAEPVRALRTGVWWCGWCGGRRTAYPLTVGWHAVGCSCARRGGGDGDGDGDAVTGVAVAWRGGAAGSVDIMWERSSLALRLDPAAAPVGRWCGRGQCGWTGVR
jgi:hypothetical protein